MHSIDFYYLVTQDPFQKQERYILKFNIEKQILYSFNQPQLFSLQGKKSLNQIPTTENPSKVAFVQSIQSLKFSLAIQQCFLWFSQIEDWETGVNRESGWKGVCSHSFKSLFSIILSLKFSSFNWSQFFTQIQNVYYRIKTRDSRSVYP